MSDLSADMIRRMQADDARLRLTETRETPPHFLPWSQRALNPFPLASSGGVWGDMPQPWAVNVLAFYASVFVFAPNNGANFWTLSLIESSASVLAQITTAAIAANAVVRLSTTTITQPGSTNQSLGIIPTATGAPGAIFIWPAVALLRTGN